MLARIGTTIAKYWVCKRTPGHVVEALECHGGAGYIEESLMPRLYREAPLNSIWEGSGNVMCLDVLRAISRQPATLDALFTELECERGSDSRLDRAVAALRQDLRDPDDLEMRARSLTERMAVVLQAALLVRHGATEVAEAFCQSRLGQHWSGAYGVLDSATDLDAIIERTGLV